MKPDKLGLKSISKLTETNHEEGNIEPSRNSLSIEKMSFIESENDTKI